MLKVLRYLLGLTLQVLVAREVGHLLSKMLNVSTLVYQSTSATEVSCLLSPSPSPPGSIHHLQRRSAADGRHRPRRYTRAGLPSHHWLCLRQSALGTADSRHSDAWPWRWPCPSARRVWTCGAVSRAADEGRVQERCMRFGGDWWVVILR